MIPIARTCKGNATFYAMLIVPFAVGLSSVALSVSSWNGVRSGLQLDADRLALTAASMLPVSEETAGHLESVLKNSIGDDKATVDVNWPADDFSSVTVTLTAQLNNSLLNFFWKAESQQISRRATAAVVPSDFVIIIADGSSLRPGATFDGINSSFESPWGSDNQWPRSDYFNCVNAPLPSDGSFGWNWWNNWNNLEFQRWLTQACFNPVWSKIKVAAIRLIDTVASDSRARLALYFTPGSNSFERFERLRSVHGEQDDEELYSNHRGGFLSDSTNTAQAKFSDFVELAYLSSDELCALMSSNPLAPDGEYLIPASELPNPHYQPCDQMIDQDICGRRHVPYGKLNKCYTKNSWTLREAVFYRQARLRTPEFQAEPDIKSAIISAFSELIDARSATSLNREVEHRHNLASKSRRQIIVFTDSLPPIDSGDDNFATSLQRVAQSGVELIFVNLFHEHLLPERRADLEARSAEITNLHERNIKVINVENLDQLESKTIPSILLNNRQLALLK